MYTSLLQRILFPASLLLGAVVVLGAFMLDAPDQEEHLAPSIETATLKVTSVDSTKNVTFDAVWQGPSLHEAGQITGQETPFEVEVPASTFRGLFRQTGGNGQLRVRLVSTAERTSEAWWSVGWDASVVMITTNGSDRAAMGM